MNERVGPDAAVGAESEETLADRRKVEAGYALVNAMWKTQGAAATLRYVHHLPHGRALPLGLDLAEIDRVIASCDSFYRGGLAKRIAADLARAGAPIAGDDLAAHRPIVATALSTDIRGATLYNAPPPTQGLVSLAILALYDRVAAQQAEGFDHLHRLVEATKQVYRAVPARREKRRLVPVLEPVLAPSPGR